MGLVGPALWFCGLFSWFWFGGCAVSVPHALIEWESDFLPEHVRRPCWEENTTAEMIARARRSGYFDNVIRDAQHIAETDGYSWVCALKLSLNYWEDRPIYPVAVHCGAVSWRVGSADTLGPSGLSPLARRVAQFAAVSVHFPVDVCSRLLGVSAREVTTAAEELQRVGFNFYRDRSGWGSNAA